MSAMVHWRWKNERQFRRLFIDGHGIYCDALKARITELQRLDQKGRKEGGESRVQICSEDGGAVYDDRQFIARNTRVIALRVPVALTVNVHIPATREFELVAPPTPAPPATAPAAPLPIRRTHWLACPLCGGSMRDAVFASCCRTSFCNECILQELGEHQCCPVCSHWVEGLHPNHKIRASFH